MEFEWDPAKAKANIRKHRVTFDFAARIFLDENRNERPDEDDREGEERWQVVGRVAEFVLVVVYVPRLDRIRIISARRAERNEFIDNWNGTVSA